MLNPDGALWVERLRPAWRAGLTLSSVDAERIIRLVAAHVQLEVACRSAVHGSRSAGYRRAFRRCAAAYRAATGLRDPQAWQSRVQPCRLCARRDHDCRPGSDPARRLSARLNILIAGGTGTGKTTLVNALLHEVAETSDRVVLIEDRRELRCAATIVPNADAPRRR